MSVRIILETEHKIVAMCEYKGEIIIATERKVYRMHRDDLTGSCVFLEVVFENKT